LHRWTYDMKGELLGAPFFEETPCVRLRSTPLTTWNGLLFTGPRDPRKDLAHITTMADWNFDGYVLDSVRVDEYDMNWKAYVETALEDYEICQRLDRGRRALYESGQDDQGPYHAPMETAEVHFHVWLHRKLGR